MGFFIVVISIRVSIVNSVVMIIRIIRVPSGVRHSSVIRVSLMLLSLSDQSYWSYVTVEERMHYCYSL